MSIEAPVRRQLRYPRILFYAVNGLGLGHVTRLLAIARAVRERQPDSEIVFFTSSEAEDVIYREGFAAFKAPSKTIRAQAGLSSSTYARMVQTVTLNLLASFHPHILVVDTFPAGSIQELLPVLRWDSRKVFVYRVQRKESAESPLMQNALQLYDLAVIPHNEGEEEIILPEGLDAAWVGPILIRTRDEARSRADSREILGLPAEGNVVYVAFGGGGDPDVDSALDALQQFARTESGIHFAVAGGPLYRGRIYRERNISAVDHYPMAELYPAFDAAISACGYNSAVELLHFGIPTAFYPLPRQVDDQEARAARIQDSGAGLAISSLDPATLTHALQTLLDPDRGEHMRGSARRLIPDSGAGRAADSILRLIGG